MLAIWVVDVAGFRIYRLGDVIALDIPDERHGLVEQISYDGNAGLDRCGSIVTGSSTSRCTVSSQT